MGFKKIDFVNRASQAVKNLEKHQYELILCAYDLNTGADGYQLFERLVKDKLINSATIFVFLSSEQNLQLSQSIIELKPDDFLLKPFTSKELKLRITRLINKKLPLKQVYQSIDNKDYKTAIQHLNHYMSTHPSSRNTPYLMKIKGEIILDMHQWQIAETFFTTINNNKAYPWSKAGLIQSLLAQKKLSESKQALEEMLSNPQTRLIALDFLSELYLKQQDYSTAMGYMKEASKLAPRNISRQQSLIELSRITHDYESQYNASKFVAINAVHSIHDCPKVYLTAVRSAIDYGLTSVNQDEIYRLTHNSDLILSNLKKRFPQVPLDEPIAIAQARLHYLNDEEAKAKNIISPKLNEQHIYNVDDLEDSLDMAKALHELGFHHDSIVLFNEIAEKSAEDSEENALFQQFITQEAQLRESISDSPKRLNTMAIEEFGRGRFKESVLAFKSAFQVMPNNATIALNYMHSMVELITKESRLSDNKGKTATPELLSTEPYTDEIASCIKLIEKASLKEDSAARFKLLKARIKI